VCDTYIDMRTAEMAPVMPLTAIEDSAVELSSMATSSFESKRLVAAPPVATVKGRLNTASAVVAISTSSMSVPQTKSGDVDRRKRTVFVDESFSPRSG